MGPTTTSKPALYKLSVRRPADGTLVFRLAGSWKLENRLPTVDDVSQQVDMGPGIRSIAFESKEISEWDSGLLMFLVGLRERCKKGHIDLDVSGLPKGARRLLALAAAVPENKSAQKESGRPPFLARIGDTATDFVKSAGDMLAFIGEAFIALQKLLRGKATFRRSDLSLLLQECGIDALPIVSLISLLVGLILAFIGAVQLMMFGAQIYVASLVGISMVRVMGAIMAGIIMAGRTGAAFAAQLGTMQVNEELDALKTMGVEPMEFLVLPRMLALTLMMPLLCLYADLMGILGGLIVGVGLLDLNMAEYINQTKESVSLNHFWVGLFHSLVFGILVALSGCLRGMQCGRSASAVGAAATSAVVTGIVSIVVATAIITLLCNVLGI